VRGPRSSLFEALQTGTGAQLEPLSIVISTQAPSDADLLSVLIDDAQRGHDPKTVLRLHTAPDEMDPFSLAAIEAANPALHVFMNKDEVLAMAESAKRMPARQAEFENLVLNRRVEASNPFVSRPAWAACGGAVADLHNVPIYAGLDLSSVSDLTALVSLDPGRSRSWTQS
jgi:phage terminase large subunit-like protein